MGIVIQLVSQSPRVSDGFAVHTCMPRILNCEFVIVLREWSLCRHTILQVRTNNARIPA